MTETGGAAGAPQAGRRQSGVPARRAVGYCLAILSVAAAVIHFAVAGSHFQEYWVFGVFMLVVAWLQLAWAVAVVARPSRLLLAAGAVLNGGIVVVYVVTRTVGDVIGPTPHDVEPLGFGDGLCTVLEAVIVVGCLCLLFARLAQPIDRSQVFVAPAITGGATVILLSVALVAGGPEMVMTASAGSPVVAAGHPSSPMSMSTTDSSIHLATKSPAGAITMPNPNMQMAAGMRMASSAACVATPTTAQQRAAVSLVNASWQQARKYQSLAAAKAAGYIPITPTGLPVVHYLNVSYYVSMLFGGPVLNPLKPQSLVYANTPKGAVLAAVMYITSPGGPTPQPGGCLTQWHVHTNLCIRGKLHVVAVINAAHPACPAGSRNKVTQPMIHVWFVPIPGGPTAVDAPDLQVVRAAERVASPHNGTA